MSAKDGRKCGTRGFSRRGRRDSTKRVAGKLIRKHVHVKVGCKHRFKYDANCCIKCGQSLRASVEAAHCS